MGKTDIKTEKMENVEQYYDEYSVQQLKKGLNLRHFKIFNKTVACGLKKEHSVLEIGCGIGTLTGLLAKYLKKGKLVAVDISPKSIEIAKARIGKTDRLEFFVTDMQDFSYPGKFDFIILPDVLEHIPIEQHNQLFGVLRRLMHDNSVIIINIPHPKNIEFNREFFPERLQIIDQALRADDLLNTIYAHDLILETYEAYKIFSDVPDYAFIKLAVNKPLHFKTQFLGKIIARKLFERIKSFLLVRF